jgi:hypothetical protein
MGWIFSNPERHERLITPNTRSLHFAVAGAPAPVGMTGAMLFGGFEMTGLIFVWRIRDDRSDVVSRIRDDRTDCCLEGFGMTGAMLFGRFRGYYTLRFGCER